MTTLVFILSELFLLYGFRCNFVLALQLEYPLRYNHDTSQLCRTGHDNVSHTRMTTLAFILSELLPLMVSHAISCPLHNLKTVWNIIMTLHSYVEQVVCIYSLPHPRPPSRPKYKKKKCSLEVIHS